MPRVCTTHSSCDPMHRTGRNADAKQTCRFVDLGVSCASRLRLQGARLRLRAQRTMAGRFSGARRVGHPRDDRPALRAPGSPALVRHGRARIEPRGQCDRPDAPAQPRWPVPARDPAVFAVRARLPGDVPPVAPHTRHADAARALLCERAGPAIHVLLRPARRRRTALRYPLPDRLADLAGAARHAAAPVHRRAALQHDDGARFPRHAGGRIAERHAQPAARHRAARRVRRVARLTVAEPPDQVVLPRGRGAFVRRGAWRGDGLAFSVHHEPLEPARERRAEVGLRSGPNHRHAYRGDARPVRPGHRVGGIAAVRQGLWPRVPLFAALFSVREPDVQQV